MIIIKQDQVTPFLNSMASKLKDTKPLMLELSQQMFNAVKENFDTEGTSLLGHKWQALKPGTIKNKQRRSRSLNILSDSGKLKSNIYPQATATEAIAGVSGKIPYAAIHQFGGSILHRPVTRVLRFRQTRGGQLMKQDSNKNLLRFAGKKHKSIDYTMTQKAYYINMPARPYLGMGQKHVLAAISTVHRFVVS